MRNTIVFLSSILAFSAFAERPICTPISTNTIEIENMRDYAFEEILFNKNIAELAFDRTNYEAMASYTSFVAMVRDFFNGTIPMAIDIIRNQRNIFAAHAGEDRAYAHDLVLNRWANRIRKASCLDIYLMQRHLSYRREISYQHLYSEFRAIILENENEVKAYFFSSLRSGGMAPNPDASFPKIKKDIENGWKAIRDIHNHPFLLRSGITDTHGSLVFSGCPGRNDCGNTSDMLVLKNSYEQWGIKIGNITNGLETIDYPIAEFYTLNP